jgi:hypothetical protein
VTSSAARDSSLAAASRQERQSALVPAPPLTYTIPNLQVKPGGGLPTAVIPETAYACWDWFRMDGAKSQLAGDTLTRLNRIVGCAMRDL